METYLLLFVGFILLVPIMYILPIEIHKRGRIILVSISLLCAALFTFTVQVIPIWQAAAAIIAILFPLGYLLSKKQFLFHQEEVFESVDHRNEVTLMDEDQIDVSQIVEDTDNNLTSFEVSVAETDNTEESVDIKKFVNNDISPVEENKDELADFYEQFEANTELNEEVTNGHKTELNSLLEVATIMDNETSSKKDEHGITDDFFSELFEGRESGEDIDQNSHQKTSITNVDVSSDLNDLFDNIMNDTPNRDAGDTLSDSKDMNDESQVENSELVSYESVETEVGDPTQQFEEAVVEELTHVYDEAIAEEQKQVVDETTVADPSQNEARDSKKDSIHEDIIIEIDESNKPDISNNVLDMLLDQLHVYRKVLPATEYEQILQKAIQEAKSEKDYFLFAKELLFYYRQTDNNDKCDLLLSDMNEKLRKYPLLIQQLLWIQ